MESILIASGQKWKLNAFYLGIGVAAILMFGASHLGNMFEVQQPAYIAIIGVLIGLGSFILICVSVKCPRCNDKWFWRAVSKKTSNNWLIWLSTQKTCPVCDNDT